MEKFHSTTGTILRKIIRIRTQGAELFFGEMSLMMI
jgi:hypothetical protein